MTRTKAHQDNREHAPVQIILLAVQLAAAQVQRKIPSVEHNFNKFVKVTSVTNSRSNLSIVAKAKLV